MTDADPNAQTSVEDASGRILTGMGAPDAGLTDRIDQHAESVPEASETSGAPSDSGGPTAAPASALPTETERDSNGQFKPKPTKGQKRFQELQHERDTFRTRAESAQDRAERAERELAELRRPKAVEPPPQEQRAKAAEPAPTTRPKPSVDQIGTVYATYEDLMEDVADWKAEQRVSALEQKIDRLVSERIEADKARQGFTSHVADTRTRGRDAYQDFDAVIQQSDAVFSPLHQMAILGVDGSEHVQYALAKDPALAQRIAALPTNGPQDMFVLGLEFAKLIPSRRAVSPASTRQPATSQAPPPYQPVGSGSKTTSPPLEDLAAAGDYEGYKARRTSDLRVATRR